MKQYLILTIKRYFIILFLLSFAIIITSQKIHVCTINNLAKTITSLFLYRFNILSFFSILLATLSTIQTYEEQNIGVAISMSGISNRKIISPIMKFSFLLAIINLLSNQFFLKDALTTINKSTPLFSKEKSIHLIQTKKGKLIYRNDYKNFIFIHSNKDIIYGKYGEPQDKQVKLFYTDNFSLKNNTYIKTISSPYQYIDINIPFLANKKTLSTAASITSLIDTYIKENTSTDLNKNLLITTIFFLLFTPLLQPFAVFISSHIAFHTTFRNKITKSLCLIIPIALGIISFLEVLKILCQESILPPLVFLVLIWLITSSPFLFLHKK